MRPSLPLALTLVLGCGASHSTVDAPPSEKTAEPRDVSPSSSDAPGSSAPAGKAQAKLQGTWEIVRYESTEPIPADAMPLVGEMFEDLRLRVSDASVEIAGKKSRFEAEDAGSGTFRLRTGGMFDKALCRFVSENEFEVDDRGPTWAGKSVLKKAR